MESMNDIRLVEIMLRAEGQLERKLAALAIFQPKMIVELTADFMPEIDITAIQFFKEFKKHHVDIARADQDKAIEIAGSCCSAKDFFHRFWPMVCDDVNTFTAAQEIISELTAVRTVRKAVRWVEQSGILEGSVING